MSHYADTQGSWELLFEQESGILASERTGSWRERKSVQEERGTPSSPHFELPIERVVVHFGHGERCELRSVDRTYQLTDEDAETVAAIANEDLIYHRLFRERFNGRPYTKEDAYQFFAWAQERWSHNESFVFFVRNERKRIVGAIDIKSATTDAAEIGYWASAESPGIMTNTVLVLCQVAKEAGYLRLFACIAINNEKSIRVVQKAHFVWECEIVRNNRPYLKFTKVL